MFQTKGTSSEAQEPPAKRQRMRTDDGSVVASLLSLILTKTNRHFRGLCEGLERASQGYIVKQCLSKQGKGII